MTQAMNRPEVQNKGRGSRKHPSTGQRYAPTGTTSHKGIMREIRINKRAEAEARSAQTMPERRRAFRRQQAAFMAVAINAA